MKHLIKGILRRIGLYYPLYYLRQFPMIIRWMRGGCSAPAPHAIKMSVVRSYLRNHNLKQFVETGTYLGDTLEYIAREGVGCTSIELSEQLHAKATQRFSGFENVSLILGDSAEQMPKLLTRLGKPTLFWLDGHYSAGFTARGEKDSPIMSELEAIYNHPVAGHVILIDDARCFDGTNDYPHLDDLLRTMRKESRYSSEVSMDIIRLVPRSVS
jgi:hypothetical protein